MTTPMPTTTPAVSPDPVVDDAILSLIATCGEGKSICPTEAAQKAHPGEQWRQILPRVRTAAIRLALEGRINILRKGKPVDPSDFRGVYRLAAT